VLTWSYRPSFQAVTQPAIVLLLCAGFGISLLNLLSRPDLPDTGASVVALKIGVAVNPEDLVPFLEVLYISAYCFDLPG